MNREQRLYSVIYDYFFSRICLGFYQEGDVLPSIGEAREMFGVSTRTIRKAYHMLEEEGYLSISRGRNAVVARGAPENQCREVCVAYFTARRDSILDLSRMSKQILPDIFLRGLLLMDGEGLDDLARLVEKIRVQNLQTQLQCFCRILAPLDNSLLSSFFWEISVFSRMTYLRGLFADEAENELDSEILRRKFMRMIAVRRAGDSEQLRTLFDRFFEDCDAHVRAHFGELASRYAGESEPEQVPFTWRVYKGRPQQGFFIAMKLIRKIYAGDYRIGEFLPSAADLAEEYGVSVITIRRTLVLLGQLGLTETINGRGTRVIPQEERVARQGLQAPAVRKNLKIFLQTVQLLALTGEPVMLAAFPHFKPDGVRRAAEMFRSETAYNIIPLICMELVADSDASPSLRELYGQMSDLFSWGVILRFLERENVVSDERREPIGEMCAGLETGDAGRFANAFRGLMFRILEGVGDRLREWGIRWEREPVVPEVPG